MKLEDQVCNLELAKKLKELRVKQKSLWYWCLTRLEDESYFELNDSNRHSSGHLFKKWYSAFTIAELGEMLPKTFGSMKSYTKGFICSHENDEEIIYDKTEANARAKMLIYLIEKGFLKDGN